MGGHSWVVSVALGWRALGWVLFTSSERAYGIAYAGLGLSVQLFCSFFFLFGLLLTANDVHDRVNDTTLPFALQARVGQPPHLKLLVDIHDHHILRRMLRASQTSASSFGSQTAERAPHRSSAGPRHSTPPCTSGLQTSVSRHKHKRWQDEYVLSSTVWSRL